MLVPVIAPFLSIITPYFDSFMIAPIFYIIQSVFQMLFDLKYVLIFFSRPLYLLFEYLISPFCKFFYQYSLLPLTTIVYWSGHIYKFIFNRFIYFPFYILKAMMLFLWRNIIQKTTIYQSIVGIFNNLLMKIIRVTLLNLQPKHLAGKLVSPIIIGASKLLYLLPTFWVDSIAGKYSQLAGRSRHVSDEEVAAVSLLLAGIGTYFFVLISGYFTRIILALLFYFGWSMDGLSSFLDFLQIFAEDDYFRFSLFPDSTVHELGLLIFTFFVPITISFRLTAYFLRLFVYFIISGRISSFIFKLISLFLVFIGVSRDPHKHSPSTTHVIKVPPPLQRKAGSGSILRKVNAARSRNPNPLASSYDSIERLRKNSFFTRCVSSPSELYSDSDSATSISNSSVPPLIPKIKIL